MKEVRFTKMHGLGNDYVYMTQLPCDEAQLPQLAQEMSDRHRGVGGDGIILIQPSTIADFKMRIFNADGSEAKMCGNGSRCVGKYVYDHGMTTKTEITLETLSGIKILRLHLGDDGRVATVTVDMGPYGSSPALQLSTSKGAVEVHPVDMGNPHAVTFVDADPDNVDVHTLGRELEHNPVWPDRANIEFAKIINPGHIKMRVWERGSGETMACGTGACATAVAAYLTGRTGNRSVVSLPGGDLTIEIDTDTHHVMMTGPATTAFYGTYNITI
jgi:diaminopimelate epimerase